MLYYDYNFEWDDNKARANLFKHSVSFDEAKTVFNDPFYIDFYDPDHSDEEERYIIIGQSQQHIHYLCLIRNVGKELV